MLKPDYVLKHYALHLVAVNLPECLESAIERVSKRDNGSNANVQIFFQFISFTAKSFLLSLHDCSEVARKEHVSCNRYKS